jgi:hypothetical protein
MEIFVKNYLGVDITLTEIIPVLRAWFLMTTLLDARVLDTLIHNHAIFHLFLYRDMKMGSYILIEHESIF